MKNKLAAVAAFAVVAAVSASAQNLINNPGFESPVVGSYASYTAGSTALTGWTIDATPSDGVQLQHLNVFGASSGSQSVQLTGASAYSAGGGVNQTIATTPGTVYQISIGLGSRSANGAKGWFNFGGIYTPLTGPAKNAWTTTNWQVTATSSSTLIDIFGTNSAGSAQLIIDNVSVAPLTGAGISADPQSATNYVGTTARFTVTATGAAPLSYQWYFNTNILLATATNATLALTNVQSGAAGVYSVTVSNAYGPPVTSGVASLTVLPLPPNPYQAAIVADHPVVYYPLDDTNGLAAVEFLNFGLYDGTCVNAPLQVESGATAWTGTSVAFDGVSQYIILGNPDALNFVGPISLEAWINNTNPYTATAGNIIAHGYGGSPVQELVMRIQDGAYYLSSYTGAGSPSLLYTIPAEDYGQWVHLVGAYDGTAWRLYRNGQQVAVTTNAQGAVNVNYNWAIAGRDGGARLLQGGVDEVAIYNYGLTPQQVANHYIIGKYGQLVVPATITTQPKSATNYAGASATFSVTADGTAPLAYRWYFNANTLIAGATNATLTLTALDGSKAGTYRVIVTNLAGSATSSVATLTVQPLPAGYAGAVIADQPLAYYPLDETNGSVAADAFLGQYNGSYMNSPTLGNAGATTNSGFSIGLDGASQNIDVANSSGLTVYETTLEAWIKPSTNYVGGEWDIIAHGPDATRKLRLAIVDGNYVVGMLVNGGTVGGTSYPMPPADLGEWVHLVGTCTGTNWNLFRNGGLVATTASLNTAGGVAVDWTIGSSAAYDSYFQGGLDEVAIYDHSLSSARVASHYLMATTRAGLVAPVISGRAALAGGSFEVMFNGPSGQPFRVLATNNVTAPPASWPVLATGTFGVGGPVLTNFVDTSATNDMSRFYRIVSP